MRKLFFLLMLTVLSVSVFAGGDKEAASADGGNDLDAWLKSAQLDKYAPAEEDWLQLKKLQKKKANL